MARDTHTRVEPELPIVGSEISPGRKLQEVRVHAGLTIEEVASRLCLRHSVIEALEADDFTGLSGLVFARGYLRAYARLLQINADEIISAFNALGIKEDKINEQRLTWQGPKVAARSSKESPVKWLILLVATFSFILAFMWWQAKSINTHTQVVQSIESEATNIANPQANLPELDNIEHREIVQDVISSEKKQSQNKTPLVKKGKKA
jgi:cytoskeleton protein RodZ